MTKKEIIVNGETRVEQKPEETSEDRGGWGSHIEFILSCVGYSVGLGNAYKNGGGAFIIPYVISVIAAGLPLYFMELALGQYSSLGVNGVFKNIAPALQGIGWGMVVVSLMVALYYNMIIAWVIFYLFNSFRSELMWSNSCHSNIEENRCKDALNDTGAVFFNLSCHNSTVAMAINDSIKAMVKMSPAEEFFEKYMLEKSDTFEETGTLSWKLVLCLAGSWIIVFLCLCKGVQSTGKVVYFTATFPYVVLCILLIRGVTLPGASNGLLFYVYPDVQKLKNWQVWKDAAEQVFFSLGPAFGGLMTMASYNKFNTNCKRDAIMIAFIDSFTSTFAGCAIFSVTGFMAYELGVPVENATKSGMNLAFVAYPEAIVRMPVSQLWSVLFFFMLITLGLDSEFAMLETVTTALIDNFPKLRPYKLFVIGGMCFSLFLLGLPFCTQAGIFIFQILNDYSSGYCVVLLALSECIVVCYIYGIRRFLKDVGMMLGSPPRYYWMATLAVITPMYLLLVFIASIIAIEPSTYGSYVLPASAQNLGLALSLVVLAPIPIFLIYYVIRGIMEKKPILSLFTATDDWCPAEERERKKQPVIAVSNNDVDIWTTKL